MNKKALLLAFMSILLMINFVSADYFFDYSPRYKTDSYKETTEFKRTTEHKTGDFWNYESTKRIITEKTEVRRRTRTPYYPSYGEYYRYDYRPYGYKPVPYSSWRYKKPYDHRDYIHAPYDDYYYKPRYDAQLGYYNWRW